MALLSPQARLALALGFVSAIGPLSIDLYLPALPGMAAELGAAPGDLQRTLSVYFLGLALAQIPIGSLSDRLGRKPVLFAGFGLFIVACMACAVATSVDALLALRFAQGASICAGTVIARAMIRDLASGPEAARLMATSFLIIGISPVMAPLIGSYLLQMMSWRGLFALLAVVALAGMAAIRWALPESLPPPKRLPRGAPILRPYLDLLANGPFIRGTLVTGLVTTIPFVYVTAAPFVFTGRYGLDAHGYSLLLGVNSVCSIGMMQLAPGLMRRWGARRLLMRVSIAGVVLCGGVALTLWVDVLGLALFQAASMMLFALAGVALAPAAITALDASGSGAGTSASALGTVQMALTALASGTVSLFSAFSVAPLLVIVGGAFAGALVLSGAARSASPSAERRAAIH